MSLRKKYWGTVGVWVFCIYSTLYIVRPICEYLKAHTPFTLLANVFILAILALGLVLTCKTIGDCKLSIKVAIFLLTGLYALGIWIISIPEEKLHFIEYGVLAYLLHKALKLDCSGIKLYFFAFILTALFGLGDEGIQHLLPNRFYQTSDVILNSVSGALGLIWVYIIEKTAKNQFADST